MDGGRGARSGYSGLAWDEVDQGSVYVRVRCSFVLGPVQARAGCSSGPRSRTGAPGASGSTSRPPLSSTGGRPPSPPSGWRSVPHGRRTGPRRAGRVEVTEADGTVVHPDTLIGRWKRLVKVANVPAIPPHGARHSYAELALSSGVRLVVVKPDAWPLIRRVHGRPGQPLQRRGGGGSDRCGAAQIAPGEVLGKCEGAGIAGPFARADRSRRGDGI
jgi:hypothetical protein